MVEQVIEKIILPVFMSCAQWTDLLFDSISGKGIVLGAFLIVLVIGLLFIPMRGNAMTNIKAYSENSIHSKKIARTKAQKSKSEGV